MAKVCLTLGGACFAMLISSCAMSQERSGEIGETGGFLGGAVLGGLLGKQHGQGKADVVKGALVGGAAGAGVGGEVGKNSSTLDIHSVAKKYLTPKF